MKSCATVNLVAGSMLALLIAFAGCSGNKPAASGDDAKPAAAPAGGTNLQVETNPERVVTTSRAETSRAETTSRAGTTSRARARAAQRKRAPPT